MSFQNENLSLLITPDACALCHWSLAAPVIQSLQQQTRTASIFAICWSATQQFSAEQIARDGKSDTETHQEKNNKAHSLSYISVLHHQQQ